jgi:hypothetical protein
MSDVREVTHEQFIEITALLGKAMVIHDASKGHNVTLAEKLVLLNEAKALREQAAAIGRT